MWITKRKQAMLRHHLCALAADWVYYSKITHHICV